MGQSGAKNTRVSLIWTVHFHQPVGNFPEEFRKYALESVQPFAQKLEAYAGIRATVHLSGPLWQWIEKEHPNILEIFRVLTQRNQVEILGGGFYEPVFETIPREDSRAQLDKMSGWLEKRFGRRPTGVWLPESIWAPDYPEILAPAGIHYTLLEDSLFLRSGLKTAQLYQTYRTESLGEPLLVLPYHRQWSEQVPVAVDDFFCGLKRAAHRESGQVVVLAQPGEIYGVAGVLEKWLQALEKEKEWIETKLGGEVTSPTRLCPPIRLASGARRVVEAHALPTEMQQVFEQMQKEMRQRYDAARLEGFWQAASWPDFLTKYPEVNAMHKKMLAVRRSLVGAQEIERTGEAWEHLYAAQCYSAYWHVEQDGAYANFLRDAVYQHLLAAESLAGKNGVARLERGDRDADGQEEIYAVQAPVSYLVRPSYGGCVAEANLWPARANVANSFARRAEAYHLREKSVPPLPVDWHERHWFQDHVLKPGTKLEQLQSGQFVELGDFMNQPYRVVSTREEGDSLEVVLERDGGVYVDPARRPLLLTKRYLWEKGGAVTVFYEWKNTGKLPLDVSLAVEVNYTCLAPDAADRYLENAGKKRACSEMVELKGQEEWQVIDASRQLAMRWKVKPATLFWQFPVYTASWQDNRLTSHYQGSAFLAVYPVNLRPGETFGHEIRCVLGINP
jgi:hypothetical protein